MPTALSPLEIILAIATGIGLAAAVGLRVFVPLLLAGFAARTGHLPLAEGFTWLASDLALVMFAVAAACEVLAYFVPLIDHLLDAVSGPVAVAAGTLLMASTLIEFAPWLRWAVALIAGGGAAGLVHGSSAGLRAGSTVTTAGLANPLLAGFELGGSVLLVVLAVALPLLALVVVVALVVALLRGLGRFLAGRRARRLVPVVVLSLIMGGAGGAQAGPADHLVDFRIKDQFDRLHTSGSCRGAVVVVVARDRKGRQFVDQWEPGLRDSLAAPVARYQVRFVPVAHLKGVPFFIKGTIRNSLPQEKDAWILMDYEGLFKRTYAMADDVCSLLIFDRVGRLVTHHAVTDFDPVVQTEVIATVRELAAAPR